MTYKYGQVKRGHVKSRRDTVLCIYTHSVIYKQGQVKRGHVKSHRDTVVVSLHTLCVTYKYGQV